MAEDIEFAKKLLALQKKLGIEIEEIYYSAVLDVTKVAWSVTYKGGIIDLKKYPSIQKNIDKALSEMTGRLNVAITSGANAAWTLSDQKNRIFIDRRFDLGKLPRGIKKTFFDANVQARKAFLSRKRNGLGLSDRIQSTVDSFKRELTNSLAIGISKGQSAKEMATDIHRNLRNPDRIFRRVRDKDGNLVLSKAAREYHPGQGVYRSSYMNALRIARTETNMAYRTADYVRWNSQRFVVGVKIQLSAAHPKTDICDSLAGNYPKDFKWVGWHPQCICYMTPILISDEEMDKYEDELLGIGTWDGNSINQVSNAPASYYRYLESNKDKINSAKSTPYWVEDNKKYTKSLKD